jgi:hypothetical protein
MLFMRNSPERLAWTVLILSFTICVGLAIGVPAGIRWLIVNLTTPLAVCPDVTANELRIQYPGNPSQTLSAGAAVAPDECTASGIVREGAILTTADDDDQAVLTVSDLAAGTTLGRITLYPNSQISVITARAPRFSQSTNAYQLLFRLDSGRVGITASFPPTRSVQARIMTPQAQVALTDTGRYSLEVGGDETQVAVIDGGMLYVEAQSQRVTLEKGQRTIISDSQPLPTAPLPAARNLIQDGNFANTLPNPVWVSYTQALTPPQGTAEVARISGRNALHFSRTGVDHAETGVIQTIERDVRPFSSLRLHLAVQVFSQSVPVCGTLGSECPIMVELRYKDELGADRSWFQGFYSLDGGDPKYCVQCGGTQSDHIRVVPTNPRPYDSPNLIEELTKGGLPEPARVLYLRIYASGHSFNAAVSEVELLAQE